MDFEAKNISRFIKNTFRRQYCFKHNKYVCRNAKFENFIVGNIAISLIPALLKESNNSKIIIANPWFRNKDRN